MKMPTANLSSGPAAVLHARIRKSFPGSERDFSLDVEFSAPAGFTILFGPSGSGKTTLLDCVAGLAAAQGEIRIADRVLLDSKRRFNLPPAKRRVGYVLQDLALFPHLSVAQNIEYGLAHLPRADRHSRSNLLLEEFRIAHLSHRLPAQVSGGERQRVALARALVTEPQALLLDEPLAALDAAAKSKILDDLRQWNRAHAIPILYVTHSREEVFALGDRVLVLDRGRIVAQGSPHEVFRAPLHETVAHLAGFENIFNAVVDSLHEDRGTMTCRVPGEKHDLLLETPLLRAEIGSTLRAGIRAGDILLASVLPVGLSARNVIPGRVVSVERRDMMISAKVFCAVEVEVYLTLAAREALQLEPDREVWLVVKTHSVHLMQS
jgi:molybdate transport system ATP-binding protein